MSDNVTVTTAADGDVSSVPTGTVISTEEVTTLNGGAVTAQQVQRVALAIRTADATAADVTAAAPLPVTFADAATATKQSDGTQKTQLVDGAGTIQATVLDYAASNPLAVRLTDTAGDYVAAGGGTQYTEDVAAAGDPTGTALIMVRDDALSGLTTTDGDNVAARGTDKGELYVKHVDAIPITDNGGSLTVDGPLTDAQLRATAVPVSVSGGATEAGLDDILAAITALSLLVDTLESKDYATQATLALMKTATDSVLTAVDGIETLIAAQADITETQPVSLASVPSHVVTGPLTDTQLRATAVPVTANAGTNLNTSALALEAGGNLAAILAKIIAAPATSAKQDDIITLLTAQALMLDGIETLIDALATLAETQPVSLASVPSHAVTGPLTDTQLRATAVPVSGTVAVTGSSTLAEQQSQTTALQLIDDVVHSGDAALSKYAVIGAVLDDVATVAVTENQASALRMSTRRALLVEGVASGTAVKVDGSAVTQPVSVASLPLPSGAGTEATLALIEASVDAVFGAVDGLEGKDFATQTTLAALLAKVIAAPSTEAKQDTAITALQLIDNIVSGTGVNVSQINGATPPIGAGTEATAVRVTLPTDGTGVLSVDDNGGSLTVDGPLTDAQLRASAVPVSGTLAVTGVATDAKLDTIITHLDGVEGFLDGLATAAETQPVSLASVPSHAVTNAGTFAVQNTPAAASAEAAANVASSATNVTLLAANATRKAASIYNDSTAILYVKFGATASATSHKIQMQAGSYFEFPMPIYPGIVDGIWASANGSARTGETT